MSERVYGNWRRPRSAGMWGLGTVPLVCLFAGGALVALVAMQRGLLAAAATAIVVCVVVVPMRFTDRYGRHVWQRALAAFAWRLGRARGQALYVSGPLARVGYGTNRQPGLASSIEALEATDGLGRPFALLWHRATTEVSVVIDTAADGAALLDDEALDVRVAMWGEWPAQLAYEPGLLGASVCVETAPGTGARLRSEVESHLDATAPGFARTVMAEIADRYPAGSATITTRVAVTWSMAPKRGRGRRDIGEMAVEVGHRLPQLTRTLSGTGAGPGRPMTVERIASCIRVAYEPGMHAWAEEHDGSSVSLEWEACGPKFQQEHAGYLFHDGACSVSWEMGQAPRGLVLSSVLTPLLAPHPKLTRKRVTLLYRPHDPASAATVVERDYRDAAFNRTNAKGLQAAARLSVAQAERTAQEEARGAGLTRFAMVVTATVSDPDALDEAVGVVEDLGLSARMALRRCWGTQAAHFTIGLPLGIVASSHLAMPEFLRELA